MNSLKKELNYYYKNHKTPKLATNTINNKIKKAVLEFEKETKKDIENLLTEKLLSKPNKYLLELMHETMLLKHKQIFGDWEK